MLATPTRSTNERSRCCRMPSGGVVDQRVDLAVGGERALDHLLGDSWLAQIAVDGHEWHAGLIARSSARRLGMTRTSPWTAPVPISTRPSYRRQWVGSAKSRRPFPQRVSELNKRNYHKFTKKITYSAR